LAVKTDDNSDAVSKNVLDWLTRIGGIAAILVNILSLFLEEKSAKQLAFGLAFIIPMASFWHQKRTNQIKIPKSKKTQTIAANRLLKTYLFLFKDDLATRIPFNRVRWIESTASSELLDQDNAKKLLRLSKQTHYWIRGINVFATALLFATLYIYLTTNYAFNPIDYAFGRDRIQRENPFISLDKGDSTMVFGADMPDLASGEQPKNEDMPIDDFSIQRTEVTNKQYRICRRAGGCKSDPIPNPTSPRYYEDAAYDDYPVVGITTFEARNFCLWLGGDLPTSTQWERAARGLHGRTWPWQGDDLTPELANLYPSDGIVSVSEFQGGISPEGVLNLVGNVAEWTRTQLITKDEGTSF